MFELMRVHRSIQRHHRLLQHVPRHSLPQIICILLAAVVTQHPPIQRVAKLERDEQLSARGTVPAFIRAEHNACTIQQQSLHCTRLRTLVYI